MTHEIVPGELRVLLLAPTAADRQLSQSLLADAGLECQVCANLKELADQVANEVGAILLTEEVLSHGDLRHLVDALESQPAWSDVPLVLLSTTGDDSPLAAWTMEQLGNVAVLERPVRLTTLVSTLRSAIRARRRQYELRDQVDAQAQSEERFRTLADNIAQFAWTADEKGSIFWYNRRWFEYTGTTLEEMQGWGWTKVHHPDHVERVVARIQHSWDTGEVWEDTFPLRGKDGNYRWFLSRAVPIRGADGKIRRWFGTNTDVTEQRATEEALRDSESRMRQLLSLMPMAVYTCDAEGRISFFNRHAAALWGREPEIGVEDEKFCGSFRLWTPEGAPMAHAQTPMAKAVNYGTSVRNEQVVIERPDGTRVTVSVNIDPLHDADGRRVGAINVFEDVTERVRAEQELKAADRRKDEFLAMLAHELRNPLAPIRTGLQVIQLCGDDRETAADTMLMMDRQLRQLVRLIDDLLDISRITSGRIELRRERCELGTVLSVAVESSRPFIEEAGVELTVSTPRRSVELDADPARLSQVFSNLLTNAAKYTQRGGHIWLTAERNDRSIVVAVRDNGIGIRPEMLDQIFDMFTQVDKTERSQGGLGIGLSLVRALVELHGGTVEARSDGPGQGSEFVVQLPVVVERSMPRETAPTSDTAANGQSHRVLVVDDNRDAAKTLSMILQLMGNKVQTAHDGLEAIAAAEAFRPDVVLLDLGMPKLNGYEAAERIRSQPWGHEMMLVALTGWGQDEDRRRSKQAGFDTHLVKPLDIDALANLLATLSPRSAPR